MRILLDTHIALWFWSGDSRLSESLRAKIQDAANEVMFHQASTMEIQLKFQLGKLELAHPPEQFVPAAVEKALFQYHTLTDSGIYFLGKLPALHRDLFDRLLIAFAVTEGFTLATVDPRVTQYPVPSMQ